MSASNDSTSEPLPNPYTSINHQRYGVLVPLVILSAPCYAFNLYHLFSKAALRKTVHNHGVAALLVVNFFVVTVDLPIMLNSYIVGKMVPQNDGFCQFWMFIDYYLFVTGLILMSFASFERHIHVFHSSWIQTRSRRLLVHYVPLLLCVIYPFCYYIGVLFLYPCSNRYDYTIGSCSSACFLASNQILAFYEFLAHGTVPTLLIGIFSIGLWVRVLLHNRKVQQMPNWSRHRKLTIQMLGISSLYLITGLPLCIVSLVQLAGVGDFGLSLIPYLIMMIYFNPTILPFVCLGVLPELRQKLNFRARRIAVTSVPNNRRQ